VGAVWTVLGSWTFDPVLSAGIILAAGAYLYAAGLVGRRTPDHPWPRRATTSFLLALAIAWIVLLGPIGAFDDTFFWAHMVQHLGLMMLVAPLILLGSPVLLILRVSTPAVRRGWIVPMLRSRTALAITNPVFGWIVFAGTLVATHFSPFFEFCLEHPLVHDYVEHPIYLLAGLIYYYPLLPGNPGPRRVSYGIRTFSLFSMMFPETMTGFFIYATSYLMYPYYASVDRPFGPPPVRDQQWGGALMWSVSMLIDAVWVTIAARHWLNNERRVAERIDLETMRGMTVATTPRSGVSE
jgi:putative copper resistance protein D